METRIEVSSALTIYSLLKERAASSPNAIAIAAPGRSPLRYGQLLIRVEDVIQTLGAMGLRHSHPIAVVLPNGPEMAVTFLSVAAAFNCAPLNPAYRTNEFDFYFSDLKAKALIVPKGSNSLAIAAATKFLVPVVELTPILDQEAGVFSLGCESTTSQDQPVAAQNHDTALILHTSGTTSRPKMVALTHANLLASARNIAATLQLTENDRCLNVMPLFHIHGLVGALLSSIVAGSSVVCTPGFDADAFVSWLDKEQPTWYTAVPTMHQAVLSSLPADRQMLRRLPLRFIRSASAPLPARVMQQLEEVFQVPAVEAYGMTEASHQIACNPLPPRPRKSGCVGLPSGTEVAVLSETGDHLPCGQSGEIAVRGANVITAYVGSLENYGNNFSNGWLRTGDQGFLDADGYIFLTGRLRETINRGGEKISPLEVDEVLKDHPAVSEAVTFAVPHETLGQDIAAAIVLREGNPATVSELQRFAAARLSDFKVPRQIFIVKSISKTATGKVQRVGLDRRLGITSSSTNGSAAQRNLTVPQTPVERKLADIWTLVLGIEIGIHDNFFQLGGDSIQAARIVSRMRASMDVELPFNAFFETPTIAEMSRTLTTGGPERPRMKALPIPEDGTGPICYGQEAIWFFEQLDPGNPAYNRPLFIELHGQLDQQALERSLNEIVRRHTVLRASFPIIDGRPIQRIAAAQPFSIALSDLSGLEKVELEFQTREIANQEARRSFDLTHGPLFRVNLLRLQADRHLLLFTTHHIVFDGWSSEIFFLELQKIYDAFCFNRPSPLPELSTQYPDFVRWQHELVQGNNLKDQLDYWKRQLDREWTILNLPTDRPAPPTRTFGGAVGFFAITEDLTSGLKALSKVEGVSLFMTLLASFNALLGRYSGQQNITIGVPFAGRNQVESEELIGCFINTLPLRTDLSGDPSCRELVSRVRKTLLEAHANQDIPFEKIVAELQFERPGRGSSLYQVLFQLRTFLTNPGKTGNLQTNEYVPQSGSSLVDLSIAIRPEKDGLECRFEYSTDLFEAATIDRMFKHWQILLEGLVAHPDVRISHLPILTDEERYQLIALWNDTRLDHSREKCIHELFEAQVERTPNATAVVFEVNQWTYQDLNRRANQLAQYLIKTGVGPESLVGICMERSLDMVVGLLAILKAGGAYVPLDPAYPKERLEFMLTDSGVSVLLTQDGLFEDRGSRRDGDQWSKIDPFVRQVRMDKDWEFIAKESHANPASSTTGSNLAYVIYTSGSTGEPKGVAIEHRNTMAFLSWVHSAFTKNELSVVLASTSTCFDLSVFEIFGPLTCGGSIIVAENAIALTTILDASRLSLLNTVPSAMTELLRLGAIPTSVKVINLAGEPLRNDLVRQIYESTAIRKVHDLYGPTECTTYSTWACRTADGPQTIGRPIANTQIYILDGHLQPVPAGIIGEIFIGGDGVARGYLNRPELTAERFISHSFDGELEWRLYRTGDLARYLPDGNIEFLGRIDDQVKIRGFRIELGEVERALGQHAAVRQVAVVAREDSTGGRDLVAYVVPRVSQPSINELRSFLRESLPEFMLPTSFVFLDSLPLTLNGKLDRKSLPALDESRHRLDQLFIEPRTPTEQTLAGIWKEVLNQETIGIYDNFFDLGGHSLLAVRVAAKIEKTFRKKLPLASFFQLATVDQLAMFLSDEVPVTPWLSLMPIRTKGSRPPFFWIHGEASNATLPRYLNPDQPIYGVVHQSEDGTPARYRSVKDIAAHYLSEIRTLQPHGPYLLGGFCFGGMVAFEMAQQLNELSEIVAILVLLAPSVPQPDRFRRVRTIANRRSARWKPLLGKFSRHLRNMKPLGFQEKVTYVLTRGKDTVVGWAAPITAPIRIQCGRAACKVITGLGYPVPLFLRSAYILDVYRQAIRRYEPKQYGGSVVLLQPDSQQAHSKSAWGELSTHRMDVIEFPGEHTEILMEPQVGVWARQLGELLDATQTNRSSPSRTLIRK